MNRSEFVQHYMNSLIGWMELRVSQAGVRSISFVEEPKFPLVADQSRIMKQLVEELDGYFTGSLTVFAVPLEDQPGTVFQRSVWEQLRAIPYGALWSYAQLAAAVGKPRAARAVGSANGRNMIPLVIPCHRVIRSDGGLGGYSSGLHIKKALLEREGVHLL